MTKFLNKINFQFIWIFFIINSCIAQSARFDSLKKYSYKLITQSSDRNLPSNVFTGFLFKYEDSYYLISTLHAFSCLDVSTKSFIDKQYQWDAVYIVFPSKTNPDGSMISVDIRPMKNWIKPIYYYEEPDIMAIKIQPPPDGEVNSIEGFIDPYTTILMSPEKVVYAGFKPPNKPDGLPILPREIMPELEENSIDGDINQLKYYDNLKRYDSLNYLLTHKTEGYNYGAPAFFIYKSKITLGGMIFGSHDKPDPKEYGLMISSQTLLTFIEMIKYQPGKLLYIANH